MGRVVASVVKTAVLAVPRPRARMCHPMVNGGTPLGFFRLCSFNTSEAAAGRVMRGISTIRTTVERDCIPNPMREVGAVGEKAAARV